MSKVNEAEVLHPDRTIDVMGHAIHVATVPTDKMQVTVREFTFGQCIELEQCAQPIIEAMGETIEGSLESLHWGKLMAALGAFPEGFRRLLCASTGLTSDSLDAMSRTDGRLVVATFLRVNWGFFLERLVERSSTRVSLSEVLKQQQTSSPDLSATATQTPRSSH